MIGTKHKTKPRHNSLMSRARFSIPSFLAGCLQLIYCSVSIANMMEKYYQSSIEKDYQLSMSHIDELNVMKNVQADPVLSWQSPHLRDCNEVATIMTSDSNSKTLETEDRFVAQIEETLHTPSFLMSIHNPAKDAVSQSIYQNGCWECFHFQDMLSALSAHPNSYFLDVGGNIGMWTLAAAAANHQTFTLEPSRDNYERICETVNRNQFHDRIHLMTIAATSVPATFTLNVPLGNKGGTSDVTVKKSTTGTGIDSNGEITTIQGFPIDSLHLPLDRPVVMKVDVEGHELEAFMGALEFLKSANMVHVAMELRVLTACSSEDQQKWKKVFDVLTSNHGLAPYRVDGNYDLFPLDPNDLSQWRHKKHPKVRYYDVVWKIIQGDSKSSKDKGAAGE